MAAGGLKAAQEADAEVQGKIDAIKGDVEAATGASYDTFEAVSFSTQVVAGINYFVKVNAGGSHLHVRIFEGLGGAAPEFVAVQTDKTADSEIAYFQESTVSGGVKAGGLHDANDGDETSQAVANAIQETCQEATGVTYDSFDVVAYSTQTVAGRNYFLKINTGDGHIHVRAFQGLGNQPSDAQFVAVETGHAADDEIEHFQDNKITGASGGKAGAMQGVKPADDDAQAKADAVKAAIEAEVGATFGTFTVVEYATQTVAGRNYFLKINCGDQHVHARVFQGLGGAEPTLAGVQAGKSADSALEYF